MKQTHTPRVPAVHRRSDSLPLGLLLALAGGFLDAYTYLARGGVFANAQTGNMILLSAAVVEGQWETAARYLLPIGAFFCGVLAAQAIRRAFYRSRLHWRQVVLCVEAMILCAAAFAPQNANALVNAAISFVCALQMNAFRKVHDSPIATTMCTGNLRAAAEQLYRGCIDGDKNALRSSGHYFSVIAVFMLGAGLGTACVRLFGQTAVLGSALVLLCAACFLRARQETRQSASEDV